MGREVAMREARWAILALALCGCATRPTPPPTPDVAQTLLPVPVVRTASVFIVPPPAPVLDLPIPDHPSVHRALTLFTTEMRSDIQESLVRSAQYRKLIDRVL